jgi:hypothetical protein
MNDELNQIESNQRQRVVIGLRIETRVCNTVNQQAAITYSYALLWQRLTTNHTRARALLRQNKQRIIKMRLQLVTNNTKRTRATNNTNSPDTTTEAAAAAAYIYGHTDYYASTNNYCNATCVPTQA